MQEKTEDIKHIQNTLWSIYKDFLSDHDVRKYTQKASGLVHEYDGNKEMLLFCQNLVITWTPIINTFAEEFRNESIHGHNSR